MEPTTTPNLAMTEPTTRRKRIEEGAHRSWEIRARYGTAESDRWTLVGNPVPAPGNPAADYENGQFATLEEAREAQQAAEASDDGTHLES